MSGGKRQYAAPSATPWDGMPGDSMTPAETAVMLSHRSMYGYRHSALSAEREVAFFNGYLREECPRCHSKLIEGNGRDRNGVRRWRCKSCGRLSLVSVEHDARKISRMPDRDNPLREVNRLCFLLETFLNSHSGFDRDDLPGWLNLFHVMMNDPEDKRRPQRCSTAQ